MLHTYSLTGNQVIDPLVSEKNVLKVFTINGLCSHLRHITQIPGAIFIIPTHGWFRYNLLLISQAA